MVHGTLGIQISHRISTEGWSPWMQQLRRTRSPLLSPTWHAVDTQKIFGEWMNEQIEEVIFIHLKQVFSDFFNFLGFDFFQNICSKIPSPLEHDFPWCNSRIQLRRCAFPPSSVSIGPSAPSRGPLRFFLAPNIAWKGLFVVGYFLQASAHSGHHPPEIMLINLHHSSLFRFNSFASCACPFPKWAHLLAPKDPP